MSRGKSFCFAESISLVCFLQIVMLLPHHHHQTCHAIVNNKTFCPTSSCGKISNIKHPFRLKNDPATCGDPSYELSCENNITTLNLFSGKYYVLEINYKNYTIRLVDAGLQEGDCSSIPRYFLTTSNFSSFYFSINDGEPYQTNYLPGYIIYLKCSKSVNDDPEYVDTAPCISSDSKSHVYAYAGGYLTVGKLKDYCKVMLVAMSSSDFHSVSVREGVPDRPLSYEEDIHAMLLYGFELSWISGACRESCGDNMGCNLNYTTGDLECYRDFNRFRYCHYPFRFQSINCNQKISKLVILVEGALQVIGTKKTYAFSEEDISLSKIGIEIGRVTGRYILPSLIVRFSLGFIVFFVLLIYTCRSRHNSIYENIEVFLRGSTLMPIRYSYKEIKKMTRGFRDKLGEGGFGAVYKGKLCSGPFVAIKMLGKSKSNGQDFINEVATIGRIHHTNVVRLIGFCVEGSKRALVYEFMPNGSLDKYISSSEDAISLTYKQMYEISLGVARGMAYLHQGCNMQILHFDIKPHNILLDENFIPKVSDFGLAKLYPNEISIVTLTAARGTIGYMAPELFYKNIGGVSYKADVYSFGMLLMEMASKRRNLNPHADRSSQLFFPFWIYNQLIEKREIEMDQISDEERNNVNKMFITALWCIQLKPSDRPSMNRVIEMLEGDIENVEMPPKPSLYPNEMIEEDLDVNSNETESENDGSISFIE
ncbi:LEAF RUST 10 DISEASE-RESISTANCEUS RECEPTOR-LIKE PROTEIN KINASE-like 2.1 isoform X2 [Medicago truncatula]|uniref:LEAF RUST 10 DISEASE-RESISTANCEUS RECEPTOR-LIKE PROTEIN KINASE-like 2.1 isoform X2 n=1 Tax=Medicago truncatula TaxID=3880 RepID=UPI000D2F27C7|nr:LEAF RUST 10 DISEASE-RESISTANCE LOCUS RECEPTOR-LIKE PROTEIN KINASE-like 2.1 isoform X2 [Medicago truncatula]